MKIEELSYQLDGTTYRGYLANESPKTEQKLPAVLVAHAWKGQDEFVRDKAKALARLGFIGFALDLYGEGREVESQTEAASMMKPLFINRKELRKRVVAGYNAVKNHPSVDPKKMAAIGFCFGGLSVLELLRSGEDLCGVVIFHGILGNSFGGIHAEMEPPHLPLSGALLLLQGYNDPFVSQEDLVSIQKEFTDANIDWQLHIYGRAAHSFTNPHANDVGGGMVYNAGAERRSWQSMVNFLSEQFS